MKRAAVLLPRLLVDDGEVRDRGRHPLVSRVRARHALAGHRVALEALPVVADDAGVELVVEDAVAPLAVAVERVGAPLAAGRGRGCPPG